MYIRYLKKNLNAFKPSEHPPVRGQNVKTFRWDHRLRRQNLFMLSFLIFSVLVANPTELLETVANPTRGLLNTDCFMVTQQLSYSKQSADAPEPHSNTFYHAAIDNNAHLQKEWCWRDGEFRLQQHNLSIQSILFTEEELTLV